MRMSHVTILFEPIFQNDLMVEIYSKSLVKAIGKVLRMQFS